MGNETKPAAPSDEDLGAALRKIATTLGQDEFEYYARRFVEWASDDTFLTLLAKRRVHRVKVFVQPPDRIDGILEHLVEMVMKVPVACVAPFESSALRSLDPDDMHPRCEESDECQRGNCRGVCVLLHGTQADGSPREPSDYRATQWEIVDGG